MADPIYLDYQVSTPIASHVLQAIGLSRAEQAGALRLSLGKWTTPAEVQAAGSILLSALAELR